MELGKLASGAYNDIVSGISGYNANPNISLEQLEDELLELRNAVIKEFWVKGILRRHELVKAINCVEVDCEDANMCPCQNLPAKNQQHFEIPPLVEGLGKDAIEYIGATDRSRSFEIYNTKEAAMMHANRRRGANKPYVYVEHTVNKNGMYDCWLFNAPFVKNIAVIGIFRDPRKLEEFDCCGKKEDYEDFGIITNEVRIDW